jgi:hypothetical protein
MGKKKLNPRLAKGGRCYDVREVSELYRVSKGTVRAWLKTGLSVIDDSRPHLIQGAVLKVFVAARRDSSREVSPPGFLRCFSCRAPRRPRPETVEFTPAEEGAGMLRGRCEACGTMMNRRTNPAQIAAVLPGLPVPITRGPERIGVCAQPPSNPHIERPGRS